jgi:hypothetical protein
MCHFGVMISPIGIREPARMKGLLRETYLTPLVPPSPQTVQLVYERTYNYQSSSSGLVRIT